MAAQPIKYTIDISDISSFQDHIERTYDRYFNAQKKNYGTIDEFTKGIGLEIKKMFHGIVYMVSKEYLESVNIPATDENISRLTIPQSCIEIMAGKMFQMGYNKHRDVLRFYLKKKKENDELTMEIDRITDEVEAAEGMLLLSGDFSSSSSSMKPVISNSTSTTQTTPLTYPGNTLRAHMQHLNINLP
jgi:hypothetical protein